MLSSMAVGVPRRERARAGRPVRVLGVVVAVGVLLAACSSASTGTQLQSDAPRAPVDRSTTAATALANSDLAVDLYHQLARQGGNFVFSPLTISVGLAELAGGASGVTALQIASVQHQRPGVDLRSGLNTILQQVDSRAGDRQNDVRQGQVSLQLPVMLWGQLDTQISPTFLDSLSRWFGSGMRMVDFRSDPGSARRAVNDWMSDQTSAEFGDIVGHGEIDEGTELTATAAAFVTAPWDQRFDAARTRQTTFHLIGGETQDATSMSITSTRGLFYAKGDGWQAVMLPYLGRQLAMVLLVPDRARFAAVTAGLDGAGFQRVLASLAPTSIDLEMPRFQFATTLPLEPLLVAAGAPSLFDENTAKLPGITADAPLWLSAFDEQAFVSADEEGMQASAPTDVHPGPPPPPPAVHLVVDRPFVVAVVDRASGEPILFGQVADPGT
jgi:serpin B